jgi:hypothetical protein
MALLKLYESASAMALPLPVSGEDFSTSSMGWYLRRYDCAVMMSTGFGGCFKVFRSGHIVRMCRSGIGSGVYFANYDSDADKMFTTGGAGVVPVYNDVIGLQHNPQDPAALTYTGTLTPSAHFNNVVYRGKYYPSPAGGTTVTSRNLATGALIDTLVLTGSLTFSANRVDITDDGWICLMDFDNASFGVIRFYHIDTGEMYESTTDRAKFMWVDRVNNNIWIYRLSDNKMVVYDMQVAPATMSAITMGANRSRYREDNLSVTLTGSNGELVKNWPVEWLMSTSEGHLEFEVTETDESGIARNRYCGPGVNDYAGASLTITARTAY